jgi:hypothetical protein
MSLTAMELPKNNGMRWSDFQVMVRPSGVETLT